MGKPKGLPKTGGRQLGTLNRKTTSLLEQCEAKGVNVFEALLEYVYTPGEPGLRLSAIKELMKYIHPQRKAIEHSGEINNPYLDKTIEELEKEVKAKLKEKK